MAKSDETVRAHVLIVDDEPEHAQTMADALRKPGHACTVVHSAADAAAELEGGMYDVIVTDLVMERPDAGLAVLAQAKAGMKFKNANSDTWTLEPAAHVAAVGSQTEKLAKQATMYLERTVQEHAGTPWAHLAAEELRIPLGYRWTESNTGVQNRREREGGNGGMPGLPADDRKQKLAPPKPSRPLKNL